MRSMLDQEVNRSKVLTSELTELLTTGSNLNQRQKGKNQVKI